MICVIGCPYSGTKYASHYYQKRNLNLLHEHERDDADGTIDWKKTTMDLSGYNAIWHLVRHPLDCISSLYDLNNSKMKYIIKQIGMDVKEVPVKKTGEFKGNRIKTAMNVWLRWNAIAEKKAQKTIRVEKLKDYQLAKKNYSKTTTELTWQDLFAVDKLLTNEVIKLGKHYGYALGGADAKI